MVDIVGVTKGDVLKGDDKLGGLSKVEWGELFELFAESVEAFGCYFFPHLLYNELGEFHREVYRELPRHKYLAVAIPRGFGKSTIGLIIYSIWHALFRHLGGISLISKSEDFVINNITRVIKSEFESNWRLKAFFGDQATKKWADTYFVLRNGVVFEGAGIGGQLRGPRNGLVILDDLETNETASSEDQRNKLKQVINKEVIPRLLPEAQLIYFGTLIHPLCYLKQILDVPDNGWEKMVYRAYHDGVEGEGHELWAQMYPHAELQARKAKMGSTAFSAEYMNNPIVDEVMPIKEAMIRYWKKMPDQYSCVIAVDPAYSEDETADFKVASVVAIDQAMNRYLVSYIRTHAPTGEFMDAILNIFLQHKRFCTGVGIPSAGVEKAFYTSFLKKMEERKVYECPVVELKNVFRGSTSVSVRNKKARIVAALQPLFEQGKYYIAPHHLEAREELLTIGVSRWDDVCFAGDTKVATVFGDKKIKDIKVGDLVITPYGVNKVLKAGCTGVKETISTFGLTGTKQHKVFSFTKGLTSMDTLCYADKVSNLTLKETLAWRYKKLLCSMELPTLLWEARDNITLVSQKTIKNGRVLRDFMWQSGNFITNKEFLKLIMFTIKTVTLLTTTSLTFSVYRAGNIIHYLKKLTYKALENIWQGLDRLLLYGINRLKEGNGIEKMLKGLLLKSHLKNSYVPFVKMSLCPSIPIPYSVQKNASRNQDGEKESITKKGSVLSAVTSLLSISMQGQKPAQRSVSINTSLKLGENKIKVYNIQVDTVGMYYANGILVSNCDSMAYAEQILQPVYFEAASPAQQQRYKSDYELRQERELIAARGDTGYGL